MRLDELELIAGNEFILDRTAQFALARRDFATRGDKLRISVADHFRTEFEEEVSKLTKTHGAGETLKTLRSLDDFVRKNLTREGLDVICRNGDPRDLNLVRRVMVSGFVAYSELDNAYLRKFGEWEDIPHIVASVERADGGISFSLRLMLDRSKFRSAANAIYEIGRSRLDELFNVTMPEFLLRRLIAISSDSAFRALGNGSIIRLLRSTEDNVRKVTALKCTRALTKDRMKKIASAYALESDQYYYNVVHWLDMGISAPRGTAVAAAKRAIERELKSD